MLGFDVMVWREGDERQPEPWKLCIARWETGVHGLEWLNNLIPTGRVEALGGNGYPFHFRIQAGALAEIFKHGLPPNSSPTIIGDDYVLPAGYNKVLTLEADKLQASPSNEWLVVHVWDMS